MSNISDYLNNTTEVTLVLWLITFLIFFVFVVILAIRISGSIKTAAQDNSQINQYLAAVPPEKIGTVNAVYQNTRKNLALALILCLVGGTFGIQRIYLGRRRSALLMFLFFWTGIPAVISLFDLANMPLIISTFNLSVIESLYNQIAAPKLEK